MFANKNTLIRSSSVALVAAGTLLSASGAEAAALANSEITTEASADSMRVISIGKDTTVKEAKGYSDAIRTASWGRVNPVIDVVNIGKVDGMPRCLKVGDTLISQLVSSYIDPANYQTTIIDTHLDACDDEHSQDVVGFELDGIIYLAKHPKALGKEEKEQTVVHELGHKKGLGHAEIWACDNEVTFNGCDESYLAADDESVMSYSDGGLAQYEESRVNKSLISNHDFTAADLYKMKELASNEIIDSPNHGEIILSGLDQAGGVKAIVLHSGGHDFIIANEPDKRAGLRLKCEPGVENSSSQNSFEIIADSGKVHTCEYIKESNAAHFVQVRVQDPNSQDAHGHNPATALLINKKRLKSFDELTATRRKPNTVLLRITCDDGIVRQVTFVGFNKKDQAVVKVETL